MNNIIDLRSDVKSMPTEKMREAMKAAALGDNMAGEDPTVNELEALAAEMFGKEACLFNPSGTMSNLLATVTHAKAGEGVTSVHYW